MLVKAESALDHVRAAERALLTLQGRSAESANLRNNFMTAGGGQEWDPQAGAVRNVPQRVIDLRTGREVGAAQGGGQAPSDNHIAWLKQNPGQAGNFDQIYGQGAAKRALGGR